MIHFHGTPITPRDQLMNMAGENFCVSAARPDDLSVCLSIGQMILFDNGAFSMKTRGEEVFWGDYYRWLAPNLAPPHLAVIPDVIDGSVEHQRELVQQWPREFGHWGMPVWHLALPIDYLLELCDKFPKVCFGSSGAYWQVGSAAWAARMDEAFNAMHRTGRLNWIHGLRMLGQTTGGWPLASADSTNVARNFKPGCAKCMAKRINAQNPTIWYTPRPLQEGLLI